MNYFTSDIHFGDVVTMVENRRPFDSIKQFDYFMIRQINKTVGADDTLYVVGDLLDCDYPNSVSWKHSLTYIKKINAKIVLIMGNNEQRIVDFFFDGDFEAFRAHCKKMGIKDVVKNAKMSFGGFDFNLVHEPKNREKDYVNLFGHCHRTRGLWTSFGINVACDINYFLPLSEDEVLYQVHKKNTFFKKDKNFRGM